MNRLIILITLFSSLNLFAFQCDSLKTLYYIEIDLRGENHPIIMSGMTDKIDFSKLSREDGVSLIKSFYSQAHYTPDFILYEGIIKKLIDKDNTISSNEIKDKGNKMMVSIDRNSREKRIILNNGENAFIRITALTGYFFFTNKEELEVPSISIELSVYDIDEIDTICIPYKITKYDKSARSFLRNVR